MNTAVGKLMALAFVLLLGVLLLAPMRAGIEDALTTAVSSVSLAPGETCMVDYTLHTETAQTVTFSSEDPTIAQIDQRGQITAMEPGRTTVRLRAQGGASARVQVEVTGVPITSFELNTRLLELEKGEVSGLSCIFNEGVTDRRVEWMSANPEIVKVDGAGRITAVGSGETYVVATTPSGFSAAATVRVRVAGTAVQIIPGEATVGVGAALQLDVRYLPEDATDSVTGWRSSQPDVLSIDSDGVARALSAGTAQVSVTTADGLHGSTTITVEPAAQDFQMNPVNLTIERGDSHTLDAWFVGADGQPDTSMNHHIQWTSSNPSVATVSDGVVTGVSSGIAVITATADGFSNLCTVKVQTSVQSVQLNMTEQYLLREQTQESFQLKASVEPADADNPQVTFSSDNTLVANVSREGLVTLTGGYGTAVITATADSGAQATFTVHVVVELPQTEASESAASVQTDVEATQ